MFKFLRSSTRNEYKVLVRRIKTTTSRGGHFKKKKNKQTNENSTLGLLSLQSGGESHNNHHKPVTLPTTLLEIVNNFQGLAASGSAFQLLLSLAERKESCKV